MISVCIFGSQARQSSDAMSDRDVLLIGQASPSLEGAMAHWTNRAWNVSVFTPSAFARLADVRALFVQHLKQEGQILRDHNKFLASTLGRFSPKSDYSAERNDALKQIAGLPSSTGAYWHDLCLADIVYVLFRNAAILHLACEGLYCFRYDELVQQIGERFALTIDEQSILLTLRGFKHCYRRRELGHIAAPYLSRARAAIDRVTRCLPNLEPSSIAVGVTTDAYYKLRHLELHLVKRFDPRQLDSLRQGDNLFEVWRQILGPADYPTDEVRIH